MISHALALAKFGLRVFPCIPKDKLPLIKAWQNEASTDSEKIAAWWAQWPNANVGVCGGAASGVVFIDIDVKPGQGGEESLADLEAKHGKLPDTVVVLTPSGGRHYYFKHPGGHVKSQNKVFPGIDCKADGGYVMGVGSVYHDGRVYTYELSSVLGEVEMAPVPSWWLEIVRSKAEVAASTSAARVDGEISKGARRPHLMSLAGSMRRRGMEAGAILAALKETNTIRCNPPLSDADVQKMVDGIMKYKAAQPRPEIHATDLGNAMRLVDRHGKDIRYCPGFGWCIWDSQRWERGNEAAIIELAKDTVRWMLYDAQNLEDGPEKTKAVKWALSSESQKSLLAMVNLSKSDPAVFCKEEQFDVDPWLFNCANGTLELKTGTLREHRQADLITKMSPVAYRPEAKRELWEASIVVAMQRNPEIGAYLQRLAGYTLTGTTGEQEIYIAWGLGGNGKTCFFEPLKAMMGEYAGTTRVETLLAQRDGGIPNDIAALRGLRMVICGEPEKSRKLRVGVVKQLTGGDTISARFMRKEFFEFKPTFKLFIATNHQPEVNDTDEGIWRRVKMLPFDYTIRAEERIKDFDKILIAEELEGILAWAVEGCLEWQRIGLATPECIDKATGNYRAEQDVLGPFFEERCEIEKVPNMMRITPTALFSGLKEWCAMSGVDAPSVKEFAAAMTERGFKRTRDSDKNRTRYYLGISLKQRQFEAD